MTVSQEKKIQHLWSRAAFGLRPDEYELCISKSVEENVKQLFADADDYKNIPAIAFTAPLQKKKNLNTKEKKEAKQMRKQMLVDLNSKWLYKMQTDKAQLTERMVFFWHGHFACRELFGNLLRDLNNTMRVYALGNFRELLIEVSKCPAMILFLNNQQNRKQHPNENFARELMELFTIGRGNYTENDVKEAARAFTGWSFDRRNLMFEFREEFHDFGEKTFFGRMGNFGGEDIIDILLEQKQTAKFITTKIYKHFVNDIIDEQRINELADSFYESKYNIAALMQKIFTADWFYDEKNIGTKIKSPIELLVSVNRTFDVRYENPRAQMYFQRALGQVLFFPPNVAGWPGGKNWIDSSSLMLRLKTPSLLLNGGIIDMNINDTLVDDTRAMMMDGMQQEINNRIQSYSDWDYFYETLPKNITKEQLMNRLLLPNAVASSKTSVEDLDKEGIKSIVLEILSLPEFQMC